MPTLWRLLRQCTREADVRAAYELGGNSVVVKAMDLKKFTQDIGCIVLAEADGKLCGIVTDRDLVVRVMAAGRDPSAVTLGDICSPHVVSLDAHATIDEAIRTMSELRREREAEVA